MNKLVTVLVLAAIILFPWVTGCNSSSSAVPSPTPSTVPGSGSTPAVEELKVHFIDVGQGDSILIDLKDTEILIDGGDRSPGVTEYIEQYVDGALEVIVATHPHADHIGGLIAVLDAFQVNQVWHNGDTSGSKTYSDFMNGVNSEGAEVHVARLHDIIEAGGLELFVHHPANLEGSTNNNSVVLHLAYGDIDFLFTGDAEQEAETNMMLLSSVRLPEVEILKFGHHGSRTASCKDFLGITSPEVAIYMAGKDNSYGHPHQETLDALTTIGAKIYGTDVNGTIIITTDSKTYSVSTVK
jgi:competence protein ComEC